MKHVVSLLLALAVLTSADAQDVKRGIPYTEKADKLQVLDVYSSPKAKNVPVVFWIHGGGWQAGDKSEVHIKPQVFNGKGFAFVSTNYRLLPNVDMATLVRDVAKAIRWVHNHIGEYGGDPKQLLIMGHSAGAQLAALLCTDARYLKEEGLSLAIIKGCVPVDGDTYDIPAMIEVAETRWRVHGLPFAKFSHRIKFGDDPAKHKDFSAVTHVAKDKGIPPFFILYVANHPDVTAQAQRLGNVLKGAGVPVTVFGARETTHNKINADLGRPDDAATTALFTFVEKVLKSEKKAEKKPAIPPTHGNVCYGKHARDVLDFWQAKAEKPTPVVICIHGGGWIGGDKSGYYGRVKTFLDAGISVVAINYRLMKQANEEKVMPPVKAPLEDAARAVQFVRSKASEWNIDKKRIGATGGSAGGASSLWLAFHDDMAEADSSDPVARESTRLYCAAVEGAQTSLDPKELLDWMPNYTYGAHAFGLKNIKEMVEQRGKILPWIKEYSAIELVTKDDPPVGLYYGGVKGAKRGEAHPDPTHSPMLGLLLVERLKQAGVDHVLVYADQPNAKLPNANAFLIHYLKRSR